MESLFQTLFIICKDNSKCVVILLYDTGFSMAQKALRSAIEKWNFQITERASLKGGEREVLMLSPKTTVQ
jgi:hypothetical protein